MAKMVRDTLDTEYKDHSHSLCRRRGNFRSCGMVRVLGAGKTARRRAYEGRYARNIGKKQIG